MVPELGAGRELPALPERLELGGGEEEYSFPVCFGVTFEKKIEKKGIDSLLFSFTCFFISIQKLHDCLWLPVDRTLDNREKRRDLDRRLDKLKRSGSTSQPIVE